MKYRLINDIINVVLPPDGVPDVKVRKHIKLRVKVIFG